MYELIGDMGNAEIAEQPARDEFVHGFVSVNTLMSVIAGKLVVDVSPTRFGARLEERATRATRDGFLVLRKMRVVL